MFARYLDLCWQSGSGTGSLLLSNSNLQHEAPRESSFGTLWCLNVLPVLSAEETKNMHITLIRCSEVWAGALMEQRPVFLYMGGLK